MKKVVKFFAQTLTASLIAGALGFSGVANAQEKILKFSVQNPKGHPIAMGAEKFAEVVNSNAAGKMKVVVYAGGSLGGDQQVVSAMQGGTVEMLVMNSGIAANQVKEFAIWDFPFLFANEKEADAVLDGPFGKKMHDKLEAKGLVGLGYWELGFRNITNSKRPINKVEDLAGLKLRVIPNPINIDWVKALDANPTPLPFPEVYGALENKAIDGQENPFSVIAANKLFEVQKYLAITKHVYNPQSVLISKKTWDSLSKEQQKILQNAVAEVTPYQRAQSRASVAESLDQLKKGGMQVTEFNDAELAKFREKMRPVIAKFGDAVGEDVVKEIQAEIAKARAKK